MRGDLLANISCKEKIWIEPNPAGREHAESLGINVVASIAEEKVGQISLFQIAPLNIVSLR